MSPSALRGSAVVLLLAVAALAPTATAAGQFPEAIAWTPTGTDVRVDSAIEIEWTMAMNGTSVEAAFALTDGMGVWRAGSFTWSHTTSSPYRTVATPRFPLRSLALYSAVVSPNATSALGNALDQDGDATGGEAADHLSWTFVTEDLGLPHVDATVPQDSASGVPVGTNVIIVFDEAMEAGSTEDAISATPSLLGAFDWGGAGQTVTFSPLLNLTYETTYTFRIRGTATDMDGRALDANRDGIGGDDYQFSFTTEADSGPPLAVSTAPADGATEVSVSEDFDLAFSESMNRSSVEAALAFTDGTTTWTRANGSFAWSGIAFADDRAAFNPHRNLPFSASISARLNASVARDRAGFGLDGDGDGVAEGSPEDDVAWAFSTEAVDTRPPEVASVAPPEGATGVSPATDVVLTFSESMDRSSVASSFRIDDGTRGWTKDNGTFSWNLGEDVVTFVPAEELTPGLVHVIRLAAASTFDVNGNGLAGNGVADGNFTSSFAVRAAPDLTPPRIVGTIPEEGEDGVDRHPRISITFDDVMDRGETQSSLVLTNSTGSSTSTVPLHEFEWSAANHTVSFRPELLLEWETWHQIIVTTGARNEAGLALEALFQLKFRTAKWNARVFGHVVDERGPVEGATVTLDGRTTQTSAAGQFELLGIQEGEYNLTVSKEGYATARETVSVSPSLLPEDSVDLDLGAVSLRRLENPLAAIALVTLVFGVLVVVAVVVLLRRRGSEGEMLDDLEPDEDDLGDVGPQP